MTTGSRLQVDQVQTYDSSKNLNVVFDDTSGSIAIDYSEYYERIASSLEAITTQTTIIANEITAISNKISDIENHQQTIKELAEGPGLHITGAYDYFGLIAIYKLMIEEGKILEAPTIQKSAVKEALQKLAEYKNIFSQLPREF